MSWEAPHDVSIHRTEWRKSSFSQGSDDCLECTPDMHGRVLIRDSKARHTAPLAIPSRHWRLAVATFRTMSSVADQT